MDSKQKSSFLQKFRGKTNLIGKQGINHLIQNMQPYHQPSVPSSSRRPSINREHIPSLAPLPKQINLDSIIPSDPKQQITRRSSQNRVVGGSKQELNQYVPSFGQLRTSNTSREMQKDQQRTHRTSQDPKGTPRQQLSRYNDYSLQKQLLSKNIQVSEDALKHLDFLNLIEGKMKGKV